MSAPLEYEARTIKGKKAVGQPPAISNPGHSGPTTFFLRSEKDMEKSAQRGRKASRSSSGVQDGSPKMQPATSGMSAMGDSSFGVESLADTISSAFASDNSLSRTNSNSTAAAGDNGSSEINTVVGRKRKAGNPVHPMIMAAGQRIISAEHPQRQQSSTRASSAASPMSLRSSESPLRTPLRRGSVSSSINLSSQPLTPLKMSPQPASAMPSTPRSGSPKSFRLSDEEASVADETGSQAILSSSGEEDEDALPNGSKASSMPQLVMPSIAIPSRRPFTERGKRMGRLKVLVVGSNGSGKTSLIQSILRTCEDIVHEDPPCQNRSGRSIDLTEHHASTRAYPSWWTDFESRRMLLQRKSIGENALERNLCFIDTPGIDEESNLQQILRYCDSSMRRTANLQSMSDSEIVNLLSGDGGVQIDAVLWVFDPRRDSELSTLMSDTPQRHLFRFLCKATNVIPLIGHADQLDPEDVPLHKEEVNRTFWVNDLEPYSFDSKPAKTSIMPSATGRPVEVFTVSSALADDVDEVDASILMSSQYMQPLIPSELADFVERLFEPDNIARMRHLAAVKFLLWRQNNLSLHMNMQQLLQPPYSGGPIPSASSAGDVLDDQSKVMVPHGSSSYFRSTSPSASDSSALSGAGIGTSAHALAHYNEQTQGPEPYRQVRLAKWAQDLQRSLYNERERYKHMYTQLPSYNFSGSNSDTEKSSGGDHEKALTQRPSKAAKGRLGGDLAIIDPRDPLGVLAFSQAFRRRGWFALQVAGGCGLIGAAAFWAVRNWAEVQEWFGFGQETVVISAHAVPAPTRGMWGWLEDMGWKGMFTW